MSHKYQTSINTLRITVGVSDDPNTMDDLDDVEDEEQYHIVKLSHARTEKVNLDIEGSCRHDRVEFEYNGSKDHNWDCTLDIKPNYVNRKAQRTSPKFEAAKFRHNTSSSSEQITTTVDHKNDTATNWRHWGRNFSVNLV